MDYSQNSEKQREERMGNLLQSWEFLLQQQSHALSLVEQYRNSLTQLRASIHDTQSFTSEEFEEIKKILSANSWLAKEFQLKTASTNPLRQLSSVFHKKHQTVLQEVKSAQSNTSDSGSPTKDTGANTNPQ